MTKTLFSPLRIVIASCAVAAAVAGTAFGVGTANPANAATVISDTAGFRDASTDIDMGITLPNALNAPYVTGKAIHAGDPSVIVLGKFMDTGIQDGETVPELTQSGDSAERLIEDDNRLIIVGEDAGYGADNVEGSMHCDAIATDAKGDQVLAVGPQGLDADTSSVSQFQPYYAADNDFYSGDSDALSPDGSKAAFGDSSKPGFVGYSADWNPNGGTFNRIDLPDTSDVPLAVNTTDAGTLTVTARKADGSVVELTSAAPLGTDAIGGANGVSEFAPADWVESAGAAASLPTSVSPSALPSDLVWDQKGDAGSWELFDLDGLPNAVTLTPNSSAGTVTSTGATELVSSDNGVYEYVLADGRAWELQAMREIAGHTGYYTPSVPPTKPTTPSSPNTPSTKPLAPQAPEVLPTAPKTPATAPAPKTQVPAPQPKLPVVSG